jgi:hypothetical protein
MRIPVNFAKGANVYEEIFSTDPGSGTRGSVTGSVRRQHGNHHGSGSSG